MNYKIPDFLLRPISEEEKKRACYERDVKKRYFTKFPQSHISMHCIEEGLNPSKEEWERFYNNMEDCIKKGKMMEELYPEWDIWDPASDDLV